MVNAPQIEVTVLVRATWTPDLTDDGEYPTIEDYRNQVRHQFTVDPIGALQKLPEPQVVRASVGIKRLVDGGHEVEGTVVGDGHVYLQPRR